MKFSDIHLIQYARIDGTMAKTFSSTDVHKWDITLRADLGGVTLTRINQRDADKLDQLWVPLANIANATPVSIPPEPKPAK